MKKIYIVLLSFGLGLLSTGCSRPGGEGEIRVSKEYLHPSAPAEIPAQVSGDVTITPAAPGSEVGTVAPTVDPGTTASGDTGGVTGTPPAEAVAPPAEASGSESEPTLPPPAVAPACTPRSQETACANQDCGMVDDGCGATFDCGTCSSSAICDTGHSAIYPQNVCRVTGDPAERCTTIPGVNGLFRCSVGPVTYCRELFGRIRPCPVEMAEVAPAQAVAIPAVPSAGTVTLAARASNGDLLLFRSTSATNHPWSHFGIRTYRIAMQLEGSPTLLYQPEGKGAPAGSGGRLHIFGRSLTNHQLAYRWCDLSEFRGNNANNCQGPGPIGFRLHTDSNPSVVLLKDGTLMGFYQADGGQMAYFKGQGGYADFREGSTIVSRLRDSREQGSCSVLWYSPSAVVKADDAGNEEIDVFGRDGDWLHGHVMRAYLPPNDFSGNNWHCEIFNGSNGGPDTGPDGLGSSPVALVNGQTHQIDLVATGLAHGGNYPILWTTDTGRNGMSSQILTSFLADYPLDQSLAVAVQNDNSPDRVLNVFFRTYDGRLGRADEHGSLPSLMHTANPYAPEQYPLTHNSPAAVADPAGNLHVFAVEHAGSQLRLVHYFRAFGAIDFRPDFPLAADLAETNASLAAVYTPETYVP